MIIIEALRKVIGAIKNKFGKEIMKKFGGLGTKLHNYLIDYGSEDKKAKHTKKCVIKIPLNLKIIKTV